MSNNVDTYEVRKAAKQLKQIVSSLRALNTSDISSMRNALKEHAAGDTANAISDVIDELGRDIDTIEKALNHIQARLECYASEVEEADRRAAEAIKG